MRIILIGNYPPDKQESMVRFANMLESGFLNAGIKTEIWWPTVFFGVRVKDTNSGIGKWLAYIDKWVIFPLVLSWKQQSKVLKGSDVRFHVCDHSNSPYLKYLPASQTVITCHDVLAIRGSMGYSDTYAPASSLGKILQKWILYYLVRAKKLASVSQLTLNQLKELVSDRLPAESKDWRVIHNAFNARFVPLEVTEVESLLVEAGLKTKIPFILHVGSGQTRKNRSLLLYMVKALGSRWMGNICFAGKALDDVLLEQAESLGLRDRLISIISPSHDTLVALYNACDAFIFPSFSEGFGWPVIEAQACGAPVIASNIEPMPEVSGGAALLADPSKPSDFADAFLSLKNQVTRSKIIERGFENSKRFETRQMIQSYLYLHGLEEAKI